ncbi:MAG: hypothetical protein ACR2GD_03080 [Pyrinomonadaceae bacterium]
MNMQEKTLKNKTHEISIGIPPETLEALEKVAERKDLPLKALLKLYVGQGLRQDLSQEEAKELALKRFKSRKGKEEKQEVD